MKYVKLKDITTKITKGTTPSNIGASFTDEGVNYFRSEMLGKSKYLDKSSGLMYISESTHNKLKRSQINPGDILFSMAGIYLGKLAIVQEEDVPANTNQAVALIRFDRNVNIDYLYYFMSQKSFNSYVNCMSAQAAQPNINLKQIGNLQIALPTDKQQKKIADILSVYDNLIENNKKRIKILEQIAENLYKEWFVRFRFLGYEHMKFIDGIPSDWQIIRMSDFCYVTDGTHDTPKPVNEGGVPLVTGKCIKNGFIDFNEPYNISYQDHESISKRSGLQTGDILFSNIGTVGTTCLVNYDREFSVKNVIIFKPDTTEISNYLYSWLNSDSIQAIFATQTNGASQQFVGLNFMRSFKILVPNENVLALYSDRIKPIRAEIVKLHDINNNLIKQRDMLLPRLMSGKLEV